MLRKISRRKCIKVVRGIVSEPLHCVVIWLFCTSWVSYNGLTLLSQKRNKNLQTLQVMYKVCSADCTSHNTRRRPAHESPHEGPTLVVKNTPWGQCGKVAQGMGQHVS